MGASFDGVSSVSDYAQKAKLYEHTHLAITDHGHLTSYYELHKECKKNNLKPVYGVEGYIVKNLVEKEGEKRIRGKNNHIILLAQNEEGYKNLLKLNYLSFSDDEHFYYNNRFSHEELFDHKNGLILGTACIASPFAQALFKEGEEGAEKVFKNFYDQFKDNMFAEVQINEIVQEIGFAKFGQRSVNEMMIKLARKYDVPIVLTGDVHYAEKDGYQVQNMSLMISQKKTINDESVFELEGKKLFYSNEEEVQQINKLLEYGYSEKDLSDWMNNSNIIANRCNFDFKERTKMHIPKISEDDDAFLVEKSRKGLMKKFNASKFEDVPENYRNQFKKEIEILVRKGFSSYSLLLSDVFDFCEKEGIMVGPARGSAAGSLVMWGLGITKIDPIKYNLLFERFLSDKRSVDTVIDYF